MKELFLKGAQWIEERFDQQQARLGWVPEVREWSKHSLFGGKAVRTGILFLVQQDPKGGLAKPDAGVQDLALALEMIHAYSLIHDDLPAMDNDDWRRNRPTLHRLVGEAKAVLVGDALLTGAFEVLGQAPLVDAVKVQALQVLAQAAGAAGMVGGQWLDVQFQNTPTFLERQEEIHRLKTGALFGAAVAMGWVARAGTKRGSLAQVREWGLKLGYLFQVVDDLLDDEVPQERMEWTQSLIKKICEDLETDARAWSEGPWVSELLRFFSHRST